MNVTLRSRVLKKPLPLLLPLAILVVVSLACSGGTSATATPAPTNTPQPTNTPEPTNTPKATLNRTATKLSQSRQTDAASTELAGQVFDYITQKLAIAGEFMGNGALIYFSGDPIVVESAQHLVISYDILSDAGIASDFAMYSKVTWAMKQQVGIANCGFLYRIGDDISLNGWYAMWVSRVSGGSGIFWWSMTGFNIYGQSEESYSSYIRDDNNAENEVLLVARNNKHSVFINGQQVGVWFNTRLTSGGFGLAAIQDTGTTSCTYNETWIWAWD